MSNARLRFISYTTLCVSILFGIVGQLLMKWTMNTMTEGFFTWSFLQRLAIALSIYSIGVVNWVIALRFVKLSVAYPLTSLNYVGILLGSYYFFDEKVPPLRVVGVFLIFIGVLLVVLSAKDSRATE